MHVVRGWSAALVILASWSCSPNDELSRDRDSAAVSAVDVNRPINGVDPFACEPLSEILSELEQYYDPKVIFGSGPQVIKKAKELNDFSVSLFGRYFRMANGVCLRASTWASA